MPGSRPKPARSPRSLQRVVRFFETQDLGECWEELPEAQFEVDLTRRSHLVGLDADLAGILAKIAHRRKMSSERLINTWLREKVQQQAGRAK